MSRNSIMDAFNAAARFSTQVVEHFNQEKQYELDTLLYRQSIKREELDRELIAAYYRVDENGVNIYQQDHDLYNNYVIERQAQWRKEADAAGNGSQYYYDRLNNLELRANENLRAQYQSMKDDAAHQREAVNYSKVISAIDNAGWDIQKTFNEKIVAHEHYKSLNTMNQAQVYQDMASIVNSGFDQVLNIDIGDMNFQKYTEALENNMQALQEVAALYLPEGESIDNFIANKQERIDAARNTAKKYIQARDFNVLDTLDNEWRRRAQDALRTGDQQQLLQVQADYFKGAQLRDAALMSDDFDNSYKARIAGMFPMISSLFGEPEGGGSRQENIEKLFKEEMPRYIQAVKEGYFYDPNQRITAYDGQKAYLDDMYKIITEQHGYQGSMSDMRRDFPIVNNFLGEYISALRKSGQHEGILNMASIFNEQVKKRYEDPRSRFDELYKDRQNMICSLLEEFGYDLIYSCDMGRTDVTDLEKRAIAFLDTMAAVDLDILRGNNLKLSGWENENDSFARAVYALSRSDTVWTDSLQRIRYNGVDEGNVNEVIIAMTSKLSRELGVPVGNKIPVGYTATEGGWDQDGIMQFKLTNDYSKTYRFTAEKNGNSFKWTLEEKTQDRDWRAITGTGYEPSGRSGSYAPAQNSITLNNSNQTLSNNKHPIDGSEFDSRELPPPDMAIPMNSWRSGYNTKTLTDQSWAAYFLRLFENPEAVINQALDRGKNPFTGEDLPPSFASRRQHFFNEFMIQIRGSSQSIQQNQTSSQPSHLNTTTADRNRNQAFMD